MNRETASRVTSHGFLADIDRKADDGEDVSVASLTKNRLYHLMEPIVVRPSTRFSSGLLTAETFGQNEGHLPCRFEWSIVFSGNNPFRQHIGYVIVREAQDLLVDILIVLTQTGGCPLQLTRCF
jgi:hypothetical protein